jgi:hypothetical protein
MVNAIVLLTHVLDVRALEYFCTLKQEGYDLFVTVDDNRVQHQNQYDQDVTFIQYDAEDCARMGYYCSNYSIYPPIRTKTRQPKIMFSSYFMC